MICYLSVCSGIEAASVAWKPLGWEAVAFAEVEPFPCSVLAHHYPETPNWGDMTQWRNWPDAAIDVLVGGTPCQSFSIAGLRGGLSDPRGGLMLQFLGIAKRYRPRWVVWENVPGVLSSNGGRDFGTFLGALGELGYGWAYRVLDAQWFGVAQRRRRVFVVGCLGDQRSAAAVLFERESVRRDNPPRREAGEGVAGTIASRFGSSRNNPEEVVAKTLVSRNGMGGFDLETETPVLVVGALDTECGGGKLTHQSIANGHIIPSQPSWWDGGQVSQTLDAVLAKGQTMPEKNRFPAVLVPKECQRKPAWIPCPEECGDYWCNIHQQHTGACECPPIDEWETDPYGMQLEGPAANQPIVLMDQGGSVMNTLTDGTVGTLRRETHGHEPVVAFAKNQSGEGGIPANIYGGNKRKDRPEGGFYVKLNEPTSKTLDLAGGLNPACSQGGTAVIAPVAIAVRTANTSANGHGISEELAHTLDQAQGQAVAIGTDCYNGAVTGDVAATMGTHGSSSNSSGPTVAVMGNIAPSLTASNDPSRSPQSSEVTQQVAAVHRAVMQVRRLTPTECERLQGFPDYYTEVPHRGKPAADGPRYKALGNSMAVPCMAWIGRRIQMLEEQA